MEQKCVLERELQDAESKLEHYDEIGTELQNKTSKLQKLSIQTAELQDQIFEVESRYQRLQSKTERIEYDNCKLIEERYVLKKDLNIATESGKVLKDWIQTAAEVTQTQQAAHLVAQLANAQPKSSVMNKLIPLPNESDEDSVPTKCNTKLIQLAPLKRKRVRVGSKKIEEEGETISRNIFDHQWTQEPAEPAQIDEWSKNLPHPKKGGMSTWNGINRLKSIYSLHPFDGVQVLTIMLGTRVISTLRTEVEFALGDDLQNLDAGWLAIRDWLLTYRPPRTDWSKITFCIQKSNEDIQDFEDRFLQTWMEYSGMTLTDETDTWDASNLNPLKTAFVAGVKPEVSDALNLVLPAWAKTGTYRDIVDRCIQIDRGLRNRTSSSAVTKAPPQDSGQTCTLAPLKSRKENIPQCFYCGKVGHWMAKCYLKQRMDSRDDNEVDNFHYNTFPPRGQPRNAHKQDAPRVTFQQDRPRLTYRDSKTSQPYPCGEEPYPRREEPYPRREESYPCREESYPHGDEPYPRRILHDDNNAMNEMLNSCPPAQRRSLCDNSKNY
ncbi:uncharacterized protein LOC119961296 [Scyliorhinus canicula]|uniref:uncharacterized protein LOC119961296 n=1 Tax=Scyliorhinus canicula TaxID=7830 RepID=UPI0018F519A2|nr:uncharacterized protein LOC119961296 [Scyliorhinus canicula]